MANPLLNPDKLEQDTVYAETMSFAGGEVMTVEGTLQVTGFIALIVLAAAVFAWTRFTIGYTDMAMGLTLFGAVVGAVLGIIISCCRFSPKLTKIKYLIPFYAVCEGFLLGGFSAYAESLYPGIVSTAIAGTFAALFFMLILYRLHIIACTDKFRAVIFISTLSIAGIYLIDLIGHFFGKSISILYSSGTLGILVSAVIIVVAALNLIIDFDYIEKAVQRHFPKDHEWFGAFGLMVTLIWLYLEILRLLIKIQSSRRS